MFLIRVNGSDIRGDFRSECMIFGILKIELSVGCHFNLCHLIHMTGELKHRAVSSLITGAE